MYLGIDFGTCYSSAAIALNGKKTQLVREPLKHGYSFPSCVYFTEQGDLLVGQAAENQHILHPERYRAGFKRDLGSPEPYILGNQPFLPEELVAAVISKLKNQADEMVKDSITEAVITVPATYRVNKRKLMEKAGKAAGFKEIRLLEEPVTAAIYYAQQYELGEEEIILVYDLGAGTFDATLLQKQGANYQILAAPVGLSHCGGMDFDREIYQDLLEHCSESLRERLDAHNRSKEAFQARAIVADLCRTLKHQLSEAQTGEILIPVTMESYALNRQDFNQMIAPLVEETLESCHQLVKNAGINWEQVDQVLLVGGSCRIPYVKEAAEKAFKQPPLLVDDPELAVCLGAAIDGFKKKELEKEKTEFNLREKAVEEELQRLERERLEAEKQARIEAERQQKEREKLEAERQARVEAERKLKQKEEQELQCLEKEQMENVERYFSQVVLYLRHEEFECSQNVDCGWQVIRCIAKNTKKIHIPGMLSSVDYRYVLILNYCHSITLKYWEEFSENCVLYAMKHQLMDNSGNWWNGKGFRFYSPILVTNSLDHTVAENIKDLPLKFCDGAFILRGIIALKNNLILFPDKINWKYKGNCDLSKKYLLNLLKIV